MVIKMTETVMTSQLSSAPDEAEKTKPTKYSLRARSIQKRMETEKRKAQPKVKQPKPKSRPPPLSKYRRKTANARERDRMKEINCAFDLLQQSIPYFPVARSNGEKITKITVLRLAISYIDALSNLIHCGENSESQSLVQSSDELIQSPLVQNRECTLMQNSKQYLHRSASISPATTIDSCLSSPPSSFLFDDSSTHLDDPLDSIENLADFHLPGGFDILLDSDGDSLFGCSDFSDLSTP